jgi:hypothetical protein
MTNANIRKAIIAHAQWGVAENAGFTYAEVRPIPYTRYQDRTLPIDTDCSGYVSCCYYCAGAPDPNGLKYDGAGFTGTLLTNLPHINKADAKPADLIVFGAYPGIHVVMLKDSGSTSDPLVFSNGSQGDPKVFPLSVFLNEFAGRTVTYLEGVIPPPVPHWKVLDLEGNVIDTTKHPVRWAMAHPKGFRKRHDTDFRQIKG